MDIFQNDLIKYSVVKIHARTFGQQIRGHKAQNLDKGRYVKLIKLSLT